MVNGQNPGGMVGETYDPSYCSVKLPGPQPLAPVDSTVAERYLHWIFKIIYHK